jgi:cellulose synthase (UDP-forming)
VAYALLAGLVVLASAWFLADWLRLPAWREEGLALGLLTALGLGHAGASLLAWPLLPRMRRPEPVDAEPGSRVAVVATFVPGLESIAMLEATLRGLVAIRYPHDTWVLDEGDDAAVQSLCRRLGARHFARTRHTEYRVDAGPLRRRTKHGNVNAWLHEVGFARYDFVTVFDADHVARPDFLDRVLGQFRDPSVGYVQAAQVYYNQRASFVARGAAEETYGFYSAVQMASAAGYPILIGCHHTHRTLALREVGGFPAHDADDLVLTLRYRAGGWRGVYVPEALARGLVPVDWSGYLGQQRRWVRSLLDVKLRVFPALARELPLAARAVGLAHGLSYLAGGLLPVATILILLYLLAAVRTPVLADLFVPSFFALVAALGLCALFAQRFYLEPSRERGLHLRAALLRFAKWPSFVLALADVLRHRQLPYVVTPKGEAPARSAPAALWAHGAAALALAAAALARSASDAPPDAALLGATALVATVSLAVLATGLLPFPPPFDPALLPRAERARADEGAAGGEPAEGRLLEGLAESAR